jgi:preprotein translocase subunit YajC
MIAVFDLAVTLAAAAAKKTSANPLSLIFIVVIVGAVYFLFLRPQQQRARRQREQTSSVEVGDEVITAGGIIGVVIETQPDRLVIESGGADSADSYGATPSRMVVLRSAISRKIPPTDAHADEYDDDDDDADHDDDDDDADHDDSDHDDSDHDDSGHDHETDGSSDSEAEEGSGA